MILYLIVISELIYAKNINSYLYKSAASTFSIVKKTAILLTSYAI